MSNPNATRPTPPDEFTAMPVSDRDHMLAELLSRDPDSMPEVLRELTMLAGAVDGLDRLAAELRARLTHVMALDEPADPNVLSSTAPPVDTALGQKVRTTYEDVVQVERILGGILGRLAV